MSQTIYPVLPQQAKRAQVTEADYHARYQRSLDDPEDFWGEQANRFISWIEPWEKVLSGRFDHFDVEWFRGAKLNAAYNCLDRHLPTRANQIALIWQGDAPHQAQTFTYQALYEQVCRFANVLKKMQVKKGDKVCLYLPMIPEAVIAMLACARIGAVHSVVFAGFSAEALKNRILDADCRMVITANEGMRGNKIIPLKKNVALALKDCPEVARVIVVKRNDHAITWDAERDVWYHDLMSQVNAECAPAIQEAHDPLFILYTSGSTGKPKGILHTTAGYLVYAAITHQWIFDYHEGDIYWCTADIGWITGHTYSIYGPLLNGATTLLFEGVPHYPSPARYWQIIDQYQVNIFYTAPTAIRALRKEGDEWVKGTSRQSLRLLGTVGEPINPEAWEWYYRVVGNAQCAIVDTWWQTETGGIMISPLPGATPLKPGSAAWPFFGIAPAILDEKGVAVATGKMGNLVITKPWPGMMKTIFGDHERFSKTYFQTYPGYYLTGDQAYQDEQGYYWIAGRSDDVIKVSGHRIGTQEVESALIQHPAVSEAAVVAVNDAVKGQAIYAYVTLKINAKPSDRL
ncbi:MAG: acetate--CoA ligase, partial [Gammaproteobacteria bacterium]|nr:acetate--CoA ligase [Gammaproteobacteria bacterium]